VLLSIILSLSDKTSGASCKLEGSQVVTVDDFCMSSYLAFRYVVSPEASWVPGIAPTWPESHEKDPQGVSSVEQIDSFLKECLSGVVPSETGLLLSSGIDSAIIAAYLPVGVKTYTIRFCAHGAVDESDRAFRFAELCGHEHQVVDVFWDDFERYSDVLMNYKKAPLHAIEVGLYKAALAAQADGLNELIVGNGADSTFGGMDKLLSKDWTFDEFVHRYTFIDPDKILKSSVDMQFEYEKYRMGDCVDVQSFLKTTHGVGIIQAFENAIHCAGCRVVAPFEDLFLDEPLDIPRIRSGESKYYLRQLFQQLFPQEKEVPEKIPFARPMDQWLGDWEGPSRGEFRDDIDLSSLTGDQKWLLYCLENFLNLVSEA
jgi:asparagine synthetase B (glutamine-hydrolysing)